MMVERQGKSLQFVTGSSGRTVSAVAEIPPSASAAFVFAHGAGAGMEHGFMTAMSAELFKHGIATLRFNFPYMEAGRRSPDRRPILTDTIRAAVGQAKQLFGHLPLFAGGKSMGGRMTSLAQSELPLEGVRGLIFLGFPLHAVGRSGSERGDHLQRVTLPLLFVQGTRDRLADIQLMRDLVLESLPAIATLLEVDDADHSFRVPKRSGRTPAEVLEDVAVRTSRWIAIQTREAGD